MDKSSHFQIPAGFDFQILLRELEFRRIRTEKMANMTDINRQRLLSDEGASGGKESSSGKKSDKKSDKKSKSAKAGRRSPSPIGAEAKRRASMLDDDDDDDDSKAGSKTF